MTTQLAPPAADVLRTDDVRLEGRVKVSGAAQYSADFARDGMLWAAFAASPYPRATITAVDTAHAKAMPGVRAVLTGADIGERFFGRVLCDWPVLATDRVLFIGQYVAAVAADTREQAEAAAREIEVTYEELPPVLDMHAALAADAPVLHDAPEKYPFLFGVRPPVPHPNVQGATHIAKGDVNAALASADRVFEQRYTTPRHHGGYIEPHATLVWLEGEIVHVISTNKSPFALRGQMAVATGVAPEKIVVEQAFIGGDFGAKGLSVDEFPCYFLARASGRPVKFVRTYLDDLQSTNTRHASDVVVKMGTTHDGKIVALDVDVLFDGGAFAAGKPVPTVVPGTSPKTPYAIPNARVDIRAVYTNTIPAGHVRAPADVQLFFAIESHLDVVARELGIDPLELRLRNAIHADETDIDGTLYREPRAVEVLEKLKTVTRWNEPLPPGRGRGMSISARHIGHGRASIVLELTRDGHLEFRTSLADQGSGAITVVQRVAARELGIPLARISVKQLPSNTGAPDMGPGASRVTHVTGQAALDAVRQLREQLDGAGWDGTAAHWESAVRALFATTAELVITGSHDGFPKPGEAEFHNFSAYAFDVSVDGETGAIAIHDVVYVADVGTIVNPIAHQGQIDGGFIYGLGHALMEELIVEDGKIANLSLADYKLPTQRDIPPFRCILLEEQLGPGPFGSKAAGEISTSGVPAALANAVAAACGARITALPITSERIYAALHPSATA